MFHLKIHSENLIKAFNEIRNELQIKILNQTLVEAVQPLLRVAKRNLKNIHNATMKSDNPKWNKDKKFVVRKSKDKAAVHAGTPFFIYRFLNVGTKNRFYITKKNKVEHKTGSIQASNFFDDAIQETEKQINENIEMIFLKRINKVVEKYNNK